MIETIAQVDRVHDAVHKAHDSKAWQDAKQALLECDTLYTLLEQEVKKGKK